MTIPSIDADPLTWVKDAEARIFRINYRDGKVLARRVFLIGLWLFFAIMMTVTMLLARGNPSFVGPMHACIILASAVGTAFFVSERAIRKTYSFYAQRRSLVRQARGLAFRIAGFNRVLLFFSPMESKLSYANKCDLEQQRVELLLELRQFKAALDAIVQADVAAKLGGVIAPSNRWTAKRKSAASAVARGK